MSSYVFCFCFISQKYVFRIYSPNFFCSILFHGHRILENETRWNKQGIKYWLTLDRYGRWKNGFSRHFLGTIVICMVRLSSLSLIQNRADDFCTSYAHLRRKRLREKPSFSINPSLQVRATVPASTCNRPRKYVQPFPQVRATVLASTCRKKTQYVFIYCLFRLSWKYMGEGIPLKSRYSLTLITWSL